MTFDKHGTAEFLRALADEIEAGNVYLTNVMYEQQVDWVDLGFNRFPGMQSLTWELELRQIRPFRFVKSPPTPDPHPQPALSEPRRELNSGTD